MINLRITCSALFILLLPPTLTSIGAPPVNKAAEGLAKAIPVYKKGGSRQAAEKQMILLIHLLSASNRDSVSSNSALIKKAMDFREDIGAQQRTTTVGAVLKAWETAYVYGAINNNHFTGRATKGRYRGETLIFENIVPQEMLPECEGYIGNLRVVPKSLARKSGDSIDRRDRAYAIGLRQVMHEAKTRAAMLEIEKSKVGHLGLTESDYEARWRAEVAETGDAYTQPPNLQLVGQRLSSPSKMNGNCYVLRVEVTNLSRHPTEVEIHSSIVGYTDNENKIYEMRKDSRTVKMRRSEVREYEVRTPNVSAFKAALKGFDPKKSQKVIYRGYTVVAKFGDEVIGSTGSDGRMMRVASGEYSAPDVISEVSRAGSIASPVIKPTYELIQFKTAEELAAGKNGVTICSGLPGTRALMADEKRLYRLDYDGTLWIYKFPSFNAPTESLGKIFAEGGVNALFSDGAAYYIHLSESAKSFSKDEVVKFTSVSDLISGENGKSVGTVSTATAALMSDGESYYKVSHEGSQYTLVHSRDLKQLLANGEIGTVGELYCGANHSGIFSDGSSYYLQVRSLSEN
ncbi:MAG: hypothetical protein P1U89_11345 [Verrucomicrobiales bacterium]|nr:hypothetical protein [Verrucomicrobiales bacterium]